MSIQQVDNIEFYNKLWAQDWQDMERFNPTARHLELMIVKLIKRIMPINSILDVGCGMGVIIKRIKKHFPNIKVTGVDISDDILYIARNYVGIDVNVEYFQLDIGQKVLDKQFDLIVCSQVLEHIKEDVTAIENMNKMCEKYMLITVPGGKHNSTSKIVGHYRHYKKKELVEIITRKGFKILYLREWGFPFHSLYKFCLDLLPDRYKRRIGFGKYGVFKRVLSETLYYLFFLNNLFNRGENIIMLVKIGEVNSGHIMLM